MNRDGRYISQWLSVGWLVFYILVCLVVLGTMLTPVFMALVGLHLGYFIWGIFMALWVFYVIVARYLASR